MNLKSPEIIDEIAVRMELVNACAEAGGKEAFAHLHRFSSGYLDSIIRGERSPGHSLLTALGYAKVTRYMKRSPARSEAA